MSDGGAVHDLQILLEDRRVVELAVQHGVRVLFGVFAVDPVDAGCFHQDLGLQLQRPQRGGRVGGDKGTARAGRQDDDSSLVEMAVGAATDVGLGNPVAMGIADINPAYHTPIVFEGVLNRQSPN